MRQHTNGKMVLESIGGLISAGVFIYENGLLRFQSATLQETAYGLLVEKQQRKLHETYTIYLEQRYLGFINEKERKTFSQKRRVEWFSRERKTFSQKRRVEWFSRERKTFSQKRSVEWFSRERKIFSQKRRAQWFSRGP
ncbi:uncharacterized protein LOC119732380 isoform X2 [Patiria miniata]|uniref:Uncharacterized protein n=1 Tax=Patiria miniata TaxID=46514 RepID=A0A914ACX2_PATMI|nr:uncharacterized protein LOC119732380 isoform X2 [Patiria miniata]